MERKEEGKIGLKAIVFNFSYVIEGGGGRTHYTLNVVVRGRVGHRFTNPTGE